MTFMSPCLFKCFSPSSARYYESLAALKKTNPNLKITVATGGWAAGSEKYSKMAASTKARETFISSVVDLLRLVASAAMLETVSRVLISKSHAIWK